LRGSAIRIHCFIGVSTVLYETHCVLSLDLEGRTIRAEFEEFTLFNLYIPNCGRDLSRVPFKLDFYAALLDICDVLHAKGRKIILYGDLNTAYQEIDVDPIVFLILSQLVFIFSTGCRDQTRPYSV